MNSDQADRKLERLFSDLRSEDAAHAPSFSRVADAGRTAAQYSVRWLRLAAAAAVIVILGASIILSQRGAAPERPVAKTPGIAVVKTPESAADANQWAALAAWTAPTDSLLTVCCLPLGSAITTPTDSWINAASEEADTTPVRGKEQS